MLEYDEVHLSQGIDANNIKESRRFIFYNHYYFLKVNLRFQPKICHRFHHNVMKTSMYFDIVAITFLQASDYTVHLWYMNKN